LAFLQVRYDLAATAPYVTNLEQINSGNTAWMLTSTALVLLMTIPGIALFYAGMVRKKFNCHCLTKFGDCLFSKCVGCSRLQSGIYTE
jgi:hypothetical protein